MAGKRDEGSQASSLEKGMVRRWLSTRPSWHRPRVRLSVRALMASVLIVSCGLGWLVHRARLQRNAVAAIRKAGGRVFYDWEFRYVPNGAFNFTGRTGGRPRGPKWLIDVLGPDYFDSVKIVYLGKARDLDSLMPDVGRLGRLEVLLINSGTLTEAGSAYLPGLARLRYLCLDRFSRVTGPALKDVARLRRLRRLDLLGSELNDADLAPLKGLTDLEYLRLYCPNLTDAGLVHLSGLSSLRRMDLGPCRITDAGLKPLAGLANLRTLVIEQPDLVDLIGMNPRAARAQLSLMLGGAGLTEQGVARLREAMPLLRIVY
jgi:hypothetical protein